jgi:hypothetical protein
MAAMDDLVFKLPEYELDGFKSDLQAGAANKVQLLGDLLDAVKLKLLVAFFPKDKVLEAAKFAFETYIRPLDVPFLDSETEKAIDDLCEQLFLAAVGLLWESINGPKAAPAV